MDTILKKLRSETTCKG